VNPLRAAGGASARTLVIGVGNAYRRDDAAGLLVARAVRAARPDLAVREESGEGAALMDAWQDADRVILCDAVASGAAPGAIHRLDAQAAPVPAHFFNYSTHAFSVAEAVELARALGRLPRRLRIYGIEGAAWAAGQEISAPVAAAVSAVTAEILADLEGDADRA
jgi:hydrogenase maturation protease